MWVRSRGGRGRGRILCLYVSWLIQEAVVKLSSHSSLHLTEIAIFAVLVALPANATQGTYGIAEEVVERIGRP